MKFRWDKKYLYWGVTAFVVIACSIMFYYLLFHGQQFINIINEIIDVCFPVIDGLIIAFLLCPMINWFEKKVFVLFRKKERREEPLSAKTAKWYRVFSITISYVIVIGALTLFFITVIPQIKLSIENIIAQSSQYKENIINWYNDFSGKYPIVAEYVDEFVSEDNLNFSFDSLKESGILPKVQNFLTTLSLSVVGFLGALWDIIIGAIVSVFVLVNKEKFAGQFKKLAYGYMGIKAGNAFISNMRMINYKFSGFIVGKIVDSIIIGILCFICCTIFKFPYPVLLALIIGATNVIPFFGPFFGAIPCMILIFMINPLQSIYFAIFILALQQFDGNILGPMILGESTGLSSFWVIFAITFFGGIWGVPGMIVGVPLFAVMFALIKTALERKLVQKELPVKTDEYIYVDHITEEKEFVALTKEIKTHKNKTGFSKLFHKKNKDK